MQDFITALHVMAVIQNNLPFFGLKKRHDAVGVERRVPFFAPMVRVRFAAEEARVPKMNASYRINSATRHSFSYSEANRKTGTGFPFSSSTSRW